MVVAEFALRTARGFDAAAVTERFFQSPLIRNLSSVESTPNAVLGGQVL